jgi:hypothetical protein
MLEGLQIEYGASEDAEDLPDMPAHEHQVLRLTDTY